MAELVLRTTLQPRGPAAALVLSDAEVAQLGTAKAFPVAVTIGGLTSRLRLSRMGGENLIGLSRAARAELGVEVGDKVEAAIAVDSGERTVDVPPALADALAQDEQVATAFGNLSYTRRKEMARLVGEAKQEATRRRRLAKILDELRG